MEKWADKVAVVTGATSGIGEETCRQLVTKGMIVVGFGRNVDKLQELKYELNENFHYIKVDVCSEENILEAFKWVKDTLKSVDVLINNAGVLKITDLLGNSDDWRLMYDTNVMGLNICSKEAIKIMKENDIKSGHIININSVAGHFKFSYLKDIAVYSSTKFSVTYLTEYLRELMLLERLPIRVTGISPGLVKTKMAELFNLENLEENNELFTTDVTDAIIFALSAPQRVNVCDIILRPSNEIRY